MFSSPSHKASTDNFVRWERRVRSAIFNSFQYNFTGHYSKYQGVKEFHLLVRLDCYYEMMVFSAFNLILSPIQEQQMMIPLKTLKCTDKISRNQGVVAMVDTSFCMSFANHSFRFINFNVQRLLST